MSNVRKIMCHAEFSCARCGKLHSAMALAPWDDLIGIAGDAQACGDGICNDCRHAEREAENNAYNKIRRQRAWVKRAQKFPSADAGGSGVG